MSQTLDQLKEDMIEVINLIEAFNEQHIELSEHELNQINLKKTDLLLQYLSVTNQENVVLFPTTSLSF